MVEVWLPYENTELPIMLPDPIDLRIQSRKLLPERREAESLKKLYTLISELDEVRVFDSLFYTGVEKNFISNLLSRLEYPYEFVSENPNVVIDIPRYDPIFGFKCSVSTYLMTLNKNKVFDIVSESSINETFYTKSFDKLPEELLYIDLILTGGTNIYDIYYSRGGSHWSELVERYKEHWSLKNEFADLIISGVGGSPWDNDLSFILSSLIKIMMYASSSSIGIVIGDGVVSEEDLEKVVSNEILNHPRDVKDIYLMNLKRLSGKYSDKKIYYFGGLPTAFLKEIGVKSLKNVERYIRTIPTKMKRAITVVEDTVHLYPFYLEGKGS